MRVHRNTTVRVVVLLLFCLAVVLFFQHTPQALRWPVRLLFVVAAGWLIFTGFQTARRTMFTGKKLLFSLILGLFFYAALNVVCHVFVRLMSQRDDRLTARGATSLSANCRLGIEAMLNATSYNLFDRDIGWVPRPGYKSELYNINRQGIRSLREYPETPPDPAKRILCMGDSFTFGFAVGDQETYPFHAEQLRPGTEWINLGISGTCLTQSLLHYRKTGRRFGGKQVVVGFMTNDAQRTVNCFRPFLSPSDIGHPFTKPFARFSDGRFSIEPNPYQDIAGFKRLLANERPELDRLRQLDYLTWSNQAITTNPILRTAAFVHESMRLDRNINMLLARPPTKKEPAKRRAGADPYGRDIWNPASPGFQAITRLLDLYCDEIVADGREPLVVIIPGPLDVENHTKHSPRQYSALIDHLKVKGQRHLDFLDPLVERHKDDLSENALFFQLHYRGPVNKELAEEIITALGLP